MTHEIVVIEPHGPGEVLFRGTLEECEVYAKETGCAYEYHYGIAYKDTETGKYDFGDGKYEPWGE